MILKKIIVLILLSSCSLSQSDTPNNNLMTASSKWNRGLPNLVLNNVNIDSESIYDAWKNISTKYFLQTVLVVSDKTPAQTRFEFSNVKCTAGDLIDAVAAKYEMQWKHDEKTGVIWIYPSGLNYDEILWEEIQLTTTYLGLPMQSGVLAPLEQNEHTNIAVKDWGNIFLNTFNSAVDIPADNYSIRDVLNISCTSNPGQTFFVEIKERKGFITAVSIVTDEGNEIPSGALFLWNAEVNSEDKERHPEDDQIITALANDNPAIRRSTRNYLESIIWSDGIERLRKKANSTEQKLWTCIAFTSILVRHEDATDLESIKLMEKLATNDFLQTCSPDLAIMTALELARLTKDSKYWEVVKKRNIERSDFLKISSDACRVAAQSNYVCEMLNTKSNLEFIGSSSPLGTMVQLPIPGILEFKMKPK